MLETEAMTYWNRQHSRRALEHRLHISPTKECVWIWLHVATHLSHSSSGDTRTTTATTSNITCHLPSRRGAAPVQEFLVSVRGEFSHSARCPVAPGHNPRAAALKWTPRSMAKEPLGLSEGGRPLAERAVPYGDSKVTVQHHGSFSKRIS